MRPRRATETAPPTATVSVGGVWVGVLPLFCAAVSRGRGGQGRAAGTGTGRDGAPPRLRLIQGSPAGAGRLRPGLCPDTPGRESDRAAPDKSRGLTKPLGGAGRRRPGGRRLGRPPQGDTRASRRRRSPPRTRWRSPRRLSSFLTPRRNSFPNSKGARLLGKVFFPPESKKA